jgi:hypothetical protein
MVRDLCRDGVDYLAFAAVRMLVRLAAEYNGKRGEIIRLTVKI